MSIYLILGIYIVIGLLLAYLSNKTKEDMDKFTFLVIMLFWIILYPLAFWRAYKEESEE